MTSRNDLDNGGPIRIFYQNARSLCNKIADLELILLSDYNLILISETWLTSNCEDVIRLFGHYKYTVFSCYRSDSRGGGILASFSYPLWENISCVDDNILVIYCSVLNLFLVLIYFPPGSQLFLLNALYAVLCNLFKSNREPKFIVIGDFNLPNLSWSNGYCEFTSLSQADEFFLDEIYCFFDLRQFVTFPTRDRNFLDLILTLHVDVIVSLGDGFSSDHECLDVIIEPSVSFHSEKLVKKVFNWKSADWGYISQILIHSDWSFLYSSVNSMQEKCDQMYRAFGDILEFIVPWKRIDTSRINWISRITIDYKRKMMCWRRRWIKFGDPRSLYLFMCSKKQYLSHLKIDRERMLNRIASSFDSDCRSFWNYISFLRKTPKTSVRPTNSILREMARDVAELYDDKLNFHFDSMQVTSHFHFSASLLLEESKKIPDFYVGPDSIPGRLIKLFVTNCLEHVVFCFVLVDQCWCNPLSMVA